jgi:hypothetical protein
MIDFIGAGIGKVKEFGGAVGDKVGAGFTKAGDAIGGWVDGGKKNIQGFYDWAVGNSLIPDLVNDIGKVMDKLPAKMSNPIEQGVMQSKKAFGPLQTGMGSATANSNVNFNISGINAGGSAGQFQQQQMRQYIEGIALQTAHTVLRQNTGFGGLI